MYIKKPVHNYSSYQVTTEKYTSLAYGLDHDIHCKFSLSSLSKHFKRCITHTRERFIMFKNKAWKKYSKLHVPYTYMKVTDELSIIKTYSFSNKTKDEALS